MSEVQRFVRIRGGVLHHHQGGVYPFPLPKGKGFFRRTLKASIVLVGVDGLELLYPERIGDTEVEKTLHGVIFSDQLTFHEFFADLCGYLSRGFARELDKGKDHKGDVSLKLRTRLL